MGVGIELWNERRASPLIDYGKSLGPHMRVGVEIGSRSGRKSTSNKNAGILAVFPADQYRRARACGMSQSPLQGSI